MSEQPDISARPVRIAVDIGGTFTDLQVFDSRSQDAWAFKVPTTPSDPSVGFMNGILGALAQALPDKIPARMTASAMSIP